MSNGTGRNRYYCNDCKLAMSAQTRRKFSKTFCMRCGECVAVVPYDKREKSQQAQRRYWTIKETLEYKRLMDKGKRPTELAERFKRTPVAMRKKAKRLGYTFD